MLLFTVETDKKAFEPFKGYPLVYVFPNQVYLDLLLTNFTE